MPWRVQSEDDNVVVKVRTDEPIGTPPHIDGQTGKEVTSEFIIQDKVTHEHVHIGLDENGETLFETHTTR